MPFFIGYFGKSLPKYFDQLKHLSDENAIAKSGISISNENLHVFAGIYKHEIQSDYIIPLNDRQGLLVGKVFDNNTYQRITDFKADESNSITKNPQFLTKHYWGRYSGILYDQNNQKITLLRDPLGLNTLFYMQTDDGIIFASELALLHDCLQKKSDLNLQYFAEYIAGENHALSSTPFVGINELQPGMIFQSGMGKRESSELMWDLEGIKDSYITNTHEFEEQLLTVLKKSVKAWISDSQSIAVELSGGLDSSAIMILLREVMNSDQKLIAINYIDSKEPSANEVPYAQEIADLCNAPLYFIDWQKPTTYEPLPHWRPNKPTTFLLLDHVDPQLHKITQSTGCTQVLNGQGGDHVFVAPPHEKFSI